MRSNDIDNAINKWTEWASNTNNKRYDIALLKVWIQFEKFMSELFVLYATGNESETGFSPRLHLRFRDEEQLNVFLREGNRTYIEYPTQIKKLSKHIFENNPFDVIFLDADNNNAYGQIIAIRNYIAHESGEARLKLLKCCFGNNERQFKEPNEYLQTIERTTRKSYYTYYVDIIKNMTRLLIQPPE